MTRKTPPHEELKAWRNSLGLTLKDAGELFGVSAVNFRAWEVGEKRPAAGPRREAIELRTGIPANAWETEKERVMVATAREATRAPSTPPPPSAPPKKRPRAVAKKAAAKPGVQRTTPKKRGKSRTKRAASVVDAGTAAA